jgi:hypothetical protein
VTAAAGFRLTGPALDEGQREVLSAALSDAIRHREARGSTGYCSDCEADPSALCPDHSADEQLADSYLQLAAELGIGVSR